jgi:large conductance mechanosensitive channel
VVDRAIGIIIGVAFGAVVASLVKGIIMPPIGLGLSGIDFSSLMAVIKQGVPPGPYANPDAAIAAKAMTIIYGVFILTVVSFLIIAARPMARAFAPKKAAEAPAPVVKDCLYCYTAIPVKARRWPNCTSELVK